VKHPTAIDALEVEMRRAKDYLDEYRERPDRWVCVRLMRRILKAGFAAIHELEKDEAAS
jgi:hypothetical protein